MLNFSYYFAETFFDTDGFQSMRVYQAKFNMLELKEKKDTEYVIGWKSKGLYTSKRIP